MTACSVIIVLCATRTQIRKLGVTATAAMQDASGPQLIDTPSSRMGRAGATTRFKLRGKLKAAVVMNIPAIWQAKRQCAKEVTRVCTAAVWRQV